MNDEYYIAGLQNFEAIVQLEFHANYFPKLSWSLRKRYSSLVDEDVEEIVSNVLKRFILNPDKINIERLGASGLRGLLTEAVFNEAKDFWKKLKQEFDGLNPLPIDDIGWDEKIFVPAEKDYQPDPPVKFASKLHEEVHELLLVLRHELAGLKGDKNLHWMYRNDKSLTPSEIAQYIGKSPGAERKAAYDLRERENRIIERELVEHPEKYPNLIAKISEEGVTLFD